MAIFVKLRIRGFTSRITCDIVRSDARKGTLLRQFSYGGKQSVPFPSARFGLSHFLHRWRFMLGVYFTFAAVQGDYGLFRRVEIAAERDALSRDLANLEAEITRWKT